MCFLVLNPFNFRIKIQWLGWVTDRSLLPAHCLVCVFVHNLFSSKRLEWGWTLKEKDSSFPWETAEPAYRESLRSCLVWQAQEQQCWHLVSEKGWEAGGSSFSDSVKDRRREQVTNGTKNCPGLKGDWTELAAVLSHWVESPALYRRTQWVCSGERVRLKSLLVLVFPLNYCEI